MTIVSQIIADGYRESNLIPINTTPTTDQTAEALRLLNRLIASVYGNEAGDELAPLAIGRNNISKPAGFPGYDNVPATDWFVPLNTQLVMNVTQVTTVWLSPTPEDGSRFGIIDKSNNLATFPLTVNGNGRTIENVTSQVYSTNGLAAEFMYRADTGNWYKVNDLIVSDEMPFPNEFDDLFTIGLAIRLNPRYQQSIDEQTASAYKRSLVQFKARYRQVIPMPSEWALIATPGVANDRYYYYGSGTAAFNAGNVYPYYRW